MQTLPKEMLANLLLFLAEHETFPAVQEQLGETMTVEEVKVALRELAGSLKKEAAGESETTSLAKESRLTKEAKELITFLSPGEERSLLKAFGFIEKTDL